MRRKARGGHELTTEEKLALFDANMKRVDKIQAGELKKPGQTPANRNAAGLAKSCTKMRGLSSGLSLVDTNILVYCYDPPYPEAGGGARDLLRRGDVRRVPPDAASIAGRVCIARSRAPAAAKDPLLAREEATLAR